MELPDEGICFPLKSEYDRVKFTLEGVRRNIPSSALELPSTDDAGSTTVHVVPAGDRRVGLGKRWMRLRALPRNTMYTPPLEDGGPELSTLPGARMTFQSYSTGKIDNITDDWNTASLLEETDTWTGTTTFLTVDGLVWPDAEGLPEAVPEKVRVQIADMASSRPWDGDEPPMPFSVDPGSFVRRADGIWCRKDTAGRLYPVNGNGERCAKLKTFEKSEGSYSDQKRPSEVSPHVWWKMMTKAERLQWWAEHPEGVPASKHTIECGPLGISLLVSDAARSVLQMWPRYLPSAESSTEASCSNDSDSDTFSTPGSDSDDDSVLPWEQWELFVSELDSSGGHHEGSCSSQTAAALRLPIDASGDAVAHREKIAISLVLTTFCVARPVGKADIEKDTRCEGSHPKGMGLTTIEVCLGQRPSPRVGRCSS